MIGPAGEVKPWSRPREVFGTASRTRFFYPVLRRLVRKNLVETKAIDNTIFSGKRYYKRLYRVDPYKAGVISKIIWGE